MNEFGGEWTKIKIDIIADYVSAYLKIMNRSRFLKLIYFDGFAGSGTIKQCNKNASMHGAAVRILSIDQPKTFDVYYFVEKHRNSYNLLSELINTKFVNRKVCVVKEDCNK